MAHNREKEHEVGTCNNLKNWKNLNENPHSYWTLEWWKCTNLRYQREEEIMLESKVKTKILYEF